MLVWEGPGRIGLGLVGGGGSQCFGPLSFTTDLFLLCSPSTPTIMWKICVLQRKLGHKGRRAPLNTAFWSPQKKRGLSSSIICNAWDTHMQFSSLLIHFIIAQLVTSWGLWFERLVIVLLFLYQVTHKYRGFNVLKGWACACVNINPDWEVMLNNYVHLSFQFSASAASLDTGLDYRNCITLRQLSKCCLCQLMLIK